MIAFACSVSAESHPENDEIISELNRSTILNFKPYIAEYDISGPSGRLLATMGSGENGSLFLKIVPTNDPKLPTAEYWWDDKDRMFYKTPDRTYRTTGLKTMARTLSLFRTSLLGGERKPVFCSPYTLLNQSRLVAGLSYSSEGYLPTDIVDELKAEFAATVIHDGKGRVVINSENFGTIILDAKDGTLLEQEFNMRKIKRVRYEIDRQGAVERMLNTFAAVNIEEVPIKVDENRRIAEMICELAIKDVDEGKLDLHELEKNIELNFNGLVEKFNVVFLDAEKCQLNDEHIKKVAHSYNDAMMKNAEENQPNETQSPNESPRLDVHRLSEATKLAIQGAILNDTVERERLIDDVLHKKLAADTGNGWKAIDMIHEFLINLYLENACLRVAREFNNLHSAPGS